MTFFEGNAVRRNNFNRTLIELTEVDDLVNDPDVTVTTYRGKDNLLNDASGANFLPGGTQRIDARFGKEFISTFKGKIEDGVLTTQTADLRLPLTIAFDSTGVHLIKDARFRLKLTADYAEGNIGGYADVWTWYLQLNTGWATHHQNYGQVSSPSLWRLMNKLADAHPDAPSDRGDRCDRGLELAVRGGRTCTDLVGLLVQPGGVDVIVLPVVAPALAGTLHDRSLTVPVDRARPVAETGRRLWLETARLRL